MATTLKRLFLIALSLIVISGCQSTPTAIYQPIEITEVVEIPNQSQEEIYNKARQWFSQYFVSGKSVVDYEDKEEGVIIGNGIANNGSSSMLALIKLQFHYNIRIDTKDGKFRALTTITKHTNTDSTNGTYDATVVSQERIDSSKQKINALVAQLKDYILKDKLQTETW